MAENSKATDLSKLVNPLASPEAKALIRYFSDIYGKRILSGQQEAPSANPPEFDVIRNETGKLPAIRALDYLHYSSAVRRPDGVTERAIDWYKNKNGIVTICWHWFAPFGGKDRQSFYTKDTTFDITKALTKGTEENMLIMYDMDIIAGQLKILRDENIPVLWRPFHEADGAWFWWGAKGAEPCKELYRLMYDYFTNYHKLNNLIWVWTFGGVPAARDWYPGNEYVDIVGVDKYFQSGDHNPNIAGYEDLIDFVKGGKLVTMPENGPIPDPDRLIEEKAGWLWFCTWWGGFISDRSITSGEQLKKTYNHPYVLTLDQLPDLKNYSRDI